MVPFIGVPFWVRIFVDPQPGCFLLFVCFPLGPAPSDAFSVCRATLARSSSTWCASCQCACNALWRRLACLASGAGPTSKIFEREPRKISSRSFYRGLRALRRHAHCILLRLPRPSAFYDGGPMCDSFCDVAMSGFRTNHSWVFCEILFMSFVTARRASREETCFRIIALTFILWDGGKAPPTSLLMFYVWRNQTFRLQILYFVDMEASRHAHLETASCGMRNRPCPLRA